MIKSAFTILAVAAAAGIALTPAAASASTASPAVLARSFGASPDPDTTVTFTVNAGGLTIDSPASADLGSGDPGTTISGGVGTVTVTDLRALLDAGWTATASATDWTTGGGTPAETIPATDVGYTPGDFTTTGTVTPVAAPITLSDEATAVVTATGVGNSTVAWDPTLSVAVPAAAVAGLYTATLSESVG